MKKHEVLKFKLDEVLKTFRDGKPDASLLELDKAYKIIMEELKELNNK